jgi:uncharacterized protein
VGGRCYDGVAQRVANGSPCSGSLSPTRAVDHQRRVSGALPARQTHRPVRVHRAVARRRPAHARRIRGESTAQECRTAKSRATAVTGGVSCCPRHGADPSRPRRRRARGGADRTVLGLGRAATRRSGEHRRHAWPPVKTGAAAAWVVEVYQGLLSPLLPRACRFAPTCSEYARLAFLEHGLARGTWLALSRLACCHPFHPGGYDPPPPRERSKP